MKAQRFYSLIQGIVSFLMFFSFCYNVIIIEYGKSEKTMRKREKILFGGFLSLLLVSSMGIALTHHWGNVSNSRSETAHSQVRFYNLDELKNLEFQQVLSGDLSTLAGRWRSQDNQKTGIQFRIEGNSFFIEDKRYYLSVTGKTEHGAIFLERPENKAAAPIIFYPKGVAIPILLDNGKIDYSGLRDPSDHSKNRIILAQTTLNSKKVSELVCYQSEAMS